MSLSECKLCLRSKIILKSHLIPRWVFLQIKHFGRHLEISRSKNTINHGQHDYRSPLLCVECEDIMRFYDESLKAMWNMRWETEKSIRGPVVQQAVWGFATVVWRFMAAERFPTIQPFYERVRLALLSRTSILLSDTLMSLVWSPLAFQQIFPPSLGFAMGKKTIHCSFAQMRFFCLFDVPGTLVVYERNDHTILVPQPTHLPPTAEKTARYLAKLREQGLMRS